MSLRPATLLSKWNPTVRYLLEKRFKLLKGANYKVGFVTGDAVAGAHILAERKLHNGASIAAGKVFIL